MRSWIRLRRPPVLLLGEGPLTAAVADGLDRSRRSSRRIGGLEQASDRLWGADVLLIADAPQPERVLAQTADMCRRRPRRQPPLRVILIEPTDSGAAAAAAADLPADLPMRIEPIAVDRRAARLLLARWPLHLGADPRFGQAVHLAIAGRAAPADALLVEALRSGHYSDRRLTITALDEDAARWQRDLEAAHPQAQQFSRLRFLRPDDPALTEAPPVTSLFVLAEPPARGLDVAQRLMRRLAAEQRVAPPTVLEVGDTEPEGELDDWDGQLYPVRHRRAVLSAGVLLDGRGDELARVIHDHYRDTTEAQGREPSQEAAARPWPALAESYRDANRHQADHLWAKLAVADCRAVSLEQVDAFSFAPVEVERLAMLEHDRWAADRWLDGWTYAPRRDNARKHHPQLIPYPELSSPMKDLDRFAVRLAPTLLARSGLGIERMLIVGCRPSPALREPQRLRPLMQAVLTRLAERNPDRSLVVAATLADAAARVFVRLALDGFGAGLFLLAERPAGDLLAQLADDDAGRRALLALLTRAERRIPLPATGDLEDWLARRAEVLVAIAAGDGPVPRPDDIGPKAVVIDAERRRVAWGFEY